MHFIEFVPAETNQLVGSNPNVIYMRKGVRPALEHDCRKYSGPLSRVGVERWSISPSYTATYCNAWLAAIHYNITNCNKLQFTITYSLLKQSVTQHTAIPTTHCKTLQHNSLQHTLQHIATHCNTLQHFATHCNALQWNAPSVLLLPLVTPHHLVHRHFHTRTRKYAHKHIIGFRETW